MLVSCGVKFLESCELSFCSRRSQQISGSMQACGNCVPANQAEGLKDISWWLRSEATTPPDSEHRNRRHPGGMPDIEYFRGEGVLPAPVYDPFRIEWDKERIVSVGVASLTPRLLSVISPKFSNPQLSDKTAAFVSGTY